MIGLLIAGVILVIIVFFSGIYIPEKRVQSAIKQAWTQWFDNIDEIHWSWALARLKDQWEGENSPSSLLDTIPAIMFRRPNRAAKKRRWRRRRQRNRRRLYWIVLHPVSRRGFKAIQLSAAELKALREAE